MRHRMYDPRTGRFTQTDPRRQNRPIKAYLYAANNPHSFVDPLGLDEVGHHKIPRELWRHVKGSLKPGVAEFLDNFTIVGKAHNRTSHPAYTKVVQGILSDFLGKDKYSIMQLDLDEVKKVAQLVDSNDAAKLFNEGVTEAFKATSVSTETGRALQKVYSENLDAFLVKAWNEGRPGAMTLAIKSPTLAKKVSPVLSRIIKGGSKVPKLKSLFIAMGVALGMMGMDSKEAMAWEGAKVADPTIVGLELVDLQLQNTARVQEFMLDETDRIGEQFKNDYERAQKRPGEYNDNDYWHERQDRLWRERRTR